MAEEYQEEMKFPLSELSQEDLQYVIGGMDEPKPSNPAPSNPAPSSPEKQSKKSLKRPRPLEIPQIRPHDVLQLESGPRIERAGMQEVLEILKKARI